MTEFRGEVRASDLLREPDPGPTPWLIDRLIVDRSLCACVGSWKTLKTFAMLEVALSVVTGLPAFDGYELQVPEPGPVVLVLEESGRKALHRRLKRMVAGRDIDPDSLDDLRCIPNQRVKLDNDDDVLAIIEFCREVKPRLVVLDPLARMKAPGRNENEQASYAVVIEHIRVIREQADAAVVFVQHQGHSGTYMRGTSDLESVWESRLGFDRKNAGPITIKPEHREAEEQGAIVASLVADDDAGTIRFVSTEEKPEDVVEMVVDWLDRYYEGTAENIAKGLTRKREIIDRALRTASEAGTVCHTPSDRLNSAGRRVNYKTWKLSVHASLPGVDTPSQASDGVTSVSSQGDSETHSVPPTPLKGGGVRDGVCDTANGPPKPGDPNYPDWLWETQDLRSEEEALRLLDHHQAVARGES